ncbi:MAG: hypothetical protein V7603_6829 [Micromonosporaceae bacterium]
MNMPAAPVAVGLDPFIVYSGQPWCTPDPQTARTIAIAPGSRRRRDVLAAWGKGGDHPCVPAVT